MVHFYALSRFISIFNSRICLYFLIVITSAMLQIYPCRLSLS
uniref:Uncharacterized protein n=1 Tax=Arundo donax TaxID=35708 RepID=A0A0A8YXV8_ARUDO